MEMFINTICMGPFRTMRPMTQVMLLLVSCFDKIKSKNYVKESRVIQIEKIMKIHHKIDFTYDISNLVNSIVKSTF